MNFEYHELDFQELIRFIRLIFAKNVKKIISLIIFLNLEVAEPK